MSHRVSREHDSRMTAQLRIRTADPGDLPVLHRVAERAVWELLAGSHYTEAQMAAARTTHAYHVEPDLVTGGTYYVLEVDGVVVAGSGWSDRSGFLRDHRQQGGAAPALVPDQGVAVMRHSYVDPDWARRGLATLLARSTETAAALAGHRRFEALCTPAGEAVRLKLGYHVLERLDVPLTDGVAIAMAHVRRDLPALAVNGAAAVRCAT